ncbi:MAG TPA: hypothetical protein VF210_12060 [Pseudomonadales bacterium]
MSGTESPPGSRRRILVATATAFAAAVVALAAFVLPAEHGVDPLGTGAALGLLALAQPEPDALQPAAAPYGLDAVAFELEPFESVEYKYRLEAGDAAVFAWQASGPVVAELHAEPDDAPEGFAVSFDRQRSAGASGSYRAEFPGWHGWFWENRGLEAVSLRLQAAGFFSAARTYRGGHVWEEPKGVPNGTPPAQAPAGSL